MLNKDGGTETDLTVVCISKNVLNYKFLRQEKDKLKFADVTDEYCVFGLFGPKRVSNETTGDDFSHSIATSKYIKIDSKIFGYKDYLMLVNLL